MQEKKAKIIRKIFPKKKDLIKYILEADSNI
jgi:hypothetical protein